MAKSVRIKPSGAVRLVVRVPPSKSLTNRVLVAAVLAEGATVVGNPSTSDDSRVLVESLQKIGFGMAKTEGDMFVDGRGGEIPSTEGTFDLGNAGTSYRFMTALVSLGTGPFVLDGSSRMRERPVGGLIDALRGLGVKARYLQKEGFPPLEICGGRLEGKLVRIKGHESSQFLSALLMVAPYAKGLITLEVEGPLVSESYVGLTLAVMEKFGAWVDRGKGPRFMVGRRTYRPTDFTIEGDASAASYYWAMAAATGGEVTVRGVGTSSLQPDAKFPDVLEAMGAQVTKTHHSITVTGGKPLRGIDADLNGSPDIVPTLAVLALFAEGTTRLRNIAHLRWKESDRLAALGAELTKVGARVAVLDDGLEITPGRLLKAEIDPHEDHRLAMAFSVAGLAGQEIVVRDPDCVAKSYPGYFEHLQRLGLPVEFSDGPEAAG
jgi:3-phosphoshikimate 1-carboxyvinyltransferase